MAYRCYHCGKKTIRGSQHRHKPGVAGRQHLRRVTHTPKNFKPNLQYARILEAGSTKRVLLCTKCRRQLKKQGKIKSWQKTKTQDEKPVLTKKVSIETEKSKQQSKKNQVSAAQLVGEKKA